MSLILLGPAIRRKSICSAQMLEKKLNFGHGSMMGQYFMFVEMPLMAKDVDQALRTIAQDEGSMSEEDAEAWVGSAKERRYKTYMSSILSINNT